MYIGSFHFDTPVILAPMAGVTDKPFRLLCRELGADLAVSEMVKANHQLRDVSPLTSRSDISDEPRPRSVQIIGNDAIQMARAAKLNESQGADIIDINMGCPAKKFARKPAGSALMAHPDQVERILKSVISSVQIPVTLKIRTGVDEANKNALEIGHIAEECGIQALSVHGRTKEQRFTGNAEHETTRQLARSLSIPILANGDIGTPIDAAQIIEYTGAAGLLVGRAARKNPWIFSQIKHYLNTGQHQSLPSPYALHRVLTHYLQSIYVYYGEERGTRVAGKQLGWCVSGYPGAANFRRNLIESKSMDQQKGLLQGFLKNL